MHSCAQTQPQSLSRGRWNHIFTDHDNKYYSFGAQLGRAKKESNQVYTKWNTVFQTITGIAYTKYQNVQNMHSPCSWTLKQFDISCKQDNLWSFKWWNHLLLRCMQSLQQDTTMLLVLVLMFFEMSHRQRFYNVNCSGTLGSNYVLEWCLDCMLFCFPSNWNCGCIAAWRYSNVQSKRTTLYIFALQ